MDMQAIKDYIGDKRMSIKNISKKFKIKGRVLYKQLNSEPDIGQVNDPTLHGSYKSTSRCWAKTENCGISMRR